MRKFFLALFLLSLSVSTGAIARSRSAAARRRSRRPVRATFSAICRPVIDQGDFTILACLQQNRPKLTVACNQVLKDHGQ